MRIESGAATHIGRRSNNEDSYCADPALGLFAVADGMGGYEGGEIASALVIASIARFLEDHRRDPDGTWPCKADRKRCLAENVAIAASRLAHREVQGRRRDRLAQMGSTLAALMLIGEQAVVVHVGDSRVYLQREGALVQLTRDHSLWAEMVAAGMDVPSREHFAYRNQITRALGIEGEVQPEVQTFLPRPGDVVLACSDGLYEPVPAPKLLALLCAASAQEASEALVAEAFARGGTDNITAVVLRFVG